MPTFKKGDTPEKQKERMERISTLKGLLDSDLLTENDKLREDLKFLREKMKRFLGPMQYRNFLIYEED